MPEETVDANMKKKKKAWCISAPRKGHLASSSVLAGPGMHILQPNQMSSSVGDRLGGRGGNKDKCLGAPGVTII